MKFTIRTLLFLTLFAGLVVSTLLEWRKYSQVRADIQTLEMQIDASVLDALYVDSHTQVCERAIENNPLPSSYYRTAKQRYEALSSAKPQFAP